MPGHALHIELARTLLVDSDRWSAPAWRHDSAARNALYHGAIGPDMGYFPGAEPLLTDLAHYVATAALTRTLFERTSNDVERAFALGWLTHVIADGEIHRIVNRSAGALRNGSAEQPSTAADSMPTHMRVEFGLDGVRLARNPDVRAVRLVPTFDRESIGFLAGAYDRTYSVDFDPASVLRSHRAVARYQPILSAFTGMIGARHLTQPLRGSALVLALAYGPARSVSGVVAPDSKVFAATHTVAPDPSTETAVNDVVAAFPSKVQHMTDGGLTDLPEINLDTGEVEDRATPYLLAVRAREELARRRAAG